MRNSKNMTIELVGISYNAKFGRKSPRQDILSTLHEPYPALHIHKYIYESAPAYAICLEDGTDIGVIPVEIAAEITQNYPLEQYSISVKLVHIEEDKDENFSEYCPTVELTFTKRENEFLITHQDLVEKLNRYGIKKTKAMLVCFDIILAILALLTILMYIIDVVIGIIFTLLVLFLLRNQLTYKKIYKSMLQQTKKTL